MLVLCSLSSGRMSLRMFLAIARSGLDLVKEANADIRVRDPSSSLMFDVIFRLLGSVYHRILKFFLFQSIFLILPSWSQDQGA